MSGTNRAKKIYQLLKLVNEREKKITSVVPCIFISHIRIDKSAAKDIGEYIMNHGNIDIYLDTYDDNLQQAADDDNPEDVTRFIEEGLDESSHLLCLVSDDTVNSWWVPYEIGFAKKSKKEIATLTLKDTKSLPAYLQISQILRGTKSLNEYLTKICENTQKSILYESVKCSLLSHSKIGHPLDAYLNWKG